MNQENLIKAFDSLMGSFKSIIGFLIFLGFLPILPMRLEADPRQIEEMFQAWQRRSSSGNLLSLVEAFTNLDPTIEDGRYLLGRLRTAVPSNELSKFIRAWAEYQFDRIDREKNQDLARALRIFWRERIEYNPDKTFFVLLHFSRSPSEGLKEFEKFYFDDALRLLMDVNNINNEFHNLKEEFRYLANLMLIHFSTHLVQLRSQFDQLRNSKDPDLWSSITRILEFPAEVLEAYHALLRSFIPLPIYEKEYPFPNKSFLYYRDKFFREYKKSIRQLFDLARTPQTFIFCTRLKFPGSFEFEDLQLQLLSEYARAFYESGPDFRDFLNYIKPLMGPPLDSTQEARELHELNEILNEVNRKNLSLDESLKIFADRLKNKEVSFGSDSIYRRLDSVLKKMTTKPFLSHCGEAIRKITGSIIGSMRRN